MPGGGPSDPDVWAPFLADPTRSALCCDFDGTIAPIVDDPDRARPASGAAAVLSRLARRLGLVAVVTGRPVTFVRAALADPALVVVGQYGLEREVGGAVEVDPRARPHLGAVAAAGDEAATTWPALRIERKGGLAVTVHWRETPAAAPAPGAVEALAARHGLAAFPGRMAVELRPAVAVDKGSALDSLLAGFADGGGRTAAFAGDDHADLAAFDRLAAWGGAADDRTVLRIAVASAESPPGLVAAADLVCADPVALVERLGALADRLDPAD